MSDWEMHYELCMKAHRDLRQKIQDRSRAVPSSHNYQTLTSDIAASVSSFTSQIQALEQGLDRGSSVTPREISRRQKLVEALQLKHRQMKSQIDDIVPVSTDQRFQLLQAPPRSGSGLADMGTVGWSLEDEDQDELVPSTSAPQLRLEQERIMAVQDEGLDTLHEVIVRQKYMAQTIGNEVEAQNHLLEDIDTGMDQTRQRLLDTTRQITNVERRDRTCRYWVVILALLVPIVILFLLPGRK